MNDPRHVGRKVLLGCALALALLTGAPAFAATYNIGLFQGATGTGSGSFTFTNPGAIGSTPLGISVSTNASSSIGVQTFNLDSLNVQVAAVNFNDNKTTAPSGSNQITGNYVEGLTGSLGTTPVAGLTPTGQCQIQLCFFRITFSFAPNPNPNVAGVKTYAIELIRQSNGNIVSTPVPNGTYSVNNTATIPEPGSLALLCIGFAALMWSATRRPRGAAA